MLKLKNFVPHGDNEISIAYNKKFLPKLSAVSQVKLGKDVVYVLSCKKERDFLYIGYVEKSKEK